MEIAEALRATKQALSLSDVHVAAAINASEKTVTRWCSGQNEPRASQLMALRRAFPLFADFLDGKAAA